jgi:hypothetical protein
MVLETERLVLDVWQSSDWAELRPIATDPEVMRNITGGVPWTDDQIRAFVDRQVRLYAERGFCRWKLLGKPALETIGFCGVGVWRDGLEPEIGWWLARPGDGGRPGGIARCLRTRTAGPDRFHREAREYGFDEDHGEARAAIRMRIRKRGRAAAALCD